MTPKEELKQLFATSDPIQIAIQITGFTGFRTGNIEELTDDEAMKLLAVYTPKSNSLQEQNSELKDALLRNAWISKILRLAENTGIKKVGDFHDFNNWMFSKSKFKKHLNAHNLEELKELHIQLKGVEANNARSALKPLTKAWWEKGKKNIKLN